VTTLEPIEYWSLTGLNDKLIGGAEEANECNREAQSR